MCFARGVSSFGVNCLSNHAYFLTVDAGARLFVGNLPDSCTQDALVALMSNYGQVPNPLACFAAVVLQERVFGLAIFLLRPVLNIRCIE